MKLRAAMFLLACGPAFADTAALSWTNPTQYTDGTALDQSITQTNLRCTGMIVNGVRSACPLSDQVATGAVTTYSWTYTISSSSNGSICFAAQTKIADGSVSDWSTEGCKTFTATRKAKPPTLTVK